MTSELHTIVVDEEAGNASLYGPTGTLLDGDIWFSTLLERNEHVVSIRAMNQEAKEVWECWDDYESGRECDRIWPDQLSESWLEPIIEER